MIFRNRSHTLIYKNSHKKNNHQRLVFPSKADQDGYIGKKQFSQKHLDKITFNLPSTERVRKFNKFNTQEIEGASPNLNLECERNVIKNKKKYNSGEKTKRMRTEEIPDSLQVLINKKNDEGKRLKSQANPQMSARTKKQNLVLTKEHILGIYARPLDLGGQNNKRRALMNPTYLSSMRRDNW